MSLNDAAVLGRVMTNVDRSMFFPDPEILETVSRKASGMLSRPVRTVVVDMSAKPAGNPRMEQLMNFGKAHSDIVRIKK